MTPWEDVRLEEDCNCCWCTGKGDKWVQWLGKLKVQLARQEVEELQVESKVGTSGRIARRIP
jgi:hypothetical protein